MYYAYDEHQQPELRKLGITGGMNQSRRRLLDESATKVWWGHGYRYYCEQILSDVYAEYHRHHEGSPKQIRQLEAKDLYQKNRSRLDAFIRKPCFHDPAVRRKIERELTRIVAVNQTFDPLFYSLSDEAGLGDLVTAWDFCFDPRTLRTMRRWLKERYGSLRSMNDAWGTAYASWPDVRPLTTDETMARGGDNLSPWADHREFMDTAFADAVKWGFDAVKKADPSARVGLVGCQMPSAFGGYDYWKLSKVIDTIEPYNIGNNREIWRSFNPGAVAVTTTFGFSENEVWRLWYQLLHGDRGIIIYDEKNRYLTAEGKPTALGKSVRPVYRELTGGVGKLLIASTRNADPVTIHYSQASIRAHWMFEAKSEGQDWLERGSAAERLRSDFLRLRESCVKLMEDQQLQVTFTAAQQLEKRHLDSSGDRLLVLPQSIAMSRKECAAVKRFVKNGGTVVADTRLALMDEHCRGLEKGQLDAFFGIRRKPVRADTLAPGPSGLRRTESTSPGVDIDDVPLRKLSAIEDISVTARSGAVALFQDRSGRPAVIVRNQGMGRTIYLNLNITDYHRWRLRPPEGARVRALITALTRSSGVRPEVTVTKSDGAYLPAVEVHPFANGTARLIGIHRNPQLRVDELGPPRYQSNKHLQKRERISVDLGCRWHVYDVRKGKPLGACRKLSLTLDPIVPTLLALYPAAVRKLSLDAPTSVRRGRACRVRATVSGGSPSATHALRLEIISPSGLAIAHYSRNLLARRGKTTHILHLAVNDKPGTYHIRVRDVATGIVSERKLQVV